MDNDDALAGVLNTIGPRLRSLRRSRGITLAELSESTGISTSTLSRLESGQRRPTLELLLLLARAHRTTLDELAHFAKIEDPRVRPKPRIRNGVTLLPLTGRPAGVHAYKMIFPAGQPAGEPEQLVHEGYEWSYILSGKLRLLLGDHDILLTPGEVVEFDTRLPHWFGNPGPGPCEVLSIFSPQGERLHIRARSDPH
ncbi:helix-turn-helix domain-containing protein [Actinoalloteichus hymeniacidonis]|uniref:Transcriptional regulator, XRE family with cupin sensor n=1 Tax=Actinoalloteichus hymeniacidonis TaxID=340345 RepID=A0AAC9MYS4_9PSEU|nr:helix-turn-helix transcriptional regulator [Actinoalloteichus hymeniacidonis]AOS63615.1 transcriptional regulator, XRE family with cupin sensor [Actinoalloteichus hymeniacidonis]MBB5908337.1 transcriptional regulator with XRE-family HTH domain [Actinoalloteichus hymeniacidonis]